MSRSRMIQQLRQLILRQQSPKLKIAWAAGLAVVVMLGVSREGWLNTDPVETSTTRPENSNPEMINGYYKFEGANLYEDQGNDGDSFLVMLPEEAEPIEFRLYFVDCPEKYINPDVPKQAERVREQAEYFGVSVEDSIAAGQEAREFVLGLLTREPFTVYTAWDEVYDSSRFQAFIEVRDPDYGKPVYLAEVLIRKGYARIHTWGEDTPDGRHWREYKDELIRMERVAKQQRAGVWGKG